MKQAWVSITEWKKKKEEKEAIALVAFICYTIADFLMPGEVNVVQQSKRKFSRGMLTSFGTHHHIVCQEIHVNTIFLRPVWSQHVSNG